MESCRPSDATALRTQATIHFFSRVIVIYRIDVASHNTWMVSPYTLFTIEPALTRDTRKFFAKYPQTGICNHHSCWHTNCLWLIRNISGCGFSIALS